MSELSKHERRVKLGPDSLPPVGAIYGVPLRDGRFGACKVVAVRLPSDPGLESPERCFALFVVATQCLRGSLPTLTDACIRGHLHYGPEHNYRGQVKGVWVDAPPPAEFVMIGVAPVCDEERLELGKTFATWRWIIGAIETAMNLRDIPEKATTSSSRREQPRLRCEKAPFEDKATFEGWKGMVPAPVVMEASEIISSAMNEMSREGVTLTAKIDALKSAILKFNALNGRKPFITTIEREDILELLTNLGESNGVSDVAADLDSLRAW